MGVGFALEGDGAVGGEEIASMLDQSHKPFDEIEDIEGNIEQFAHLGGVDALVVQVHGIQLTFGEHHSEEVDRQIPLPYRQDPVSHYLHLL